MPSCSCVGTVFDDRRGRKASDCCCCSCCIRPGYAPEDLLDISSSRTSREPRDKRRDGSGRMLARWSRVAMEDLVDISVDSFGISIGSPAGRGEMVPSVDGEALAVHAGGFSSGDRDALDRLRDRGDGIPSGSVGTRNWPF